jgi:hypothetical protein
VPLDLGSRPEWLLSGEAGLATDQDLALGDLDRLETNEASVTGPPESSSLSSTSKP